MVNHLEIHCLGASSHDCLPSGPPFSKHLHLSFFVFGGDPWEVAMVNPILAFCLHSCAHCLLCCQLAPTLHLEYCILKLNEIVNNQFTERFGAFTIYKNHLVKNFRHKLEQSNAALQKRELLKKYLHIS